MIDSKDSPYSDASDVYSLGMTILEVLTLRPPFSHRRYDTVVILDVIRGHRPHKPAEFFKLVWTLLELCWSADPIKRPNACVVEDWLNTACFLERFQIQ